MISLYIDTSSNYLYSGIVIDDILVSEIKNKYEKAIDFLNSYPDERA